MIRHREITGMRSSGRFPDGPPGQDLMVLAPRAAEVALPAYIIMKDNVLNRDNVIINDRAT
jgi:hypothetical protein